MYHKKIFIGNLTLKTRSKQIKSFLKKLGLEIGKIELKRVESIQTQFAIVEVESEEDFNKLLNKNDIEFRKIQLIIREYQPPKICPVIIPIEVILNGKETYEVEIEGKKYEVRIKPFKHEGFTFYIECDKKIEIKYEKLDENQLKELKEMKEEVLKEKINYEKNKFLQKYIKNENYQNYEEEIIEGESILVCLSIFSISQSRILSPSIISSS